MPTSPAAPLLPFTPHPLPTFLLHLSPPKPPQRPNARSCQTVRGARCGREIANTHRSTHNTWCLRQDNKGCICRKHTDRERNRQKEGERECECVWWSSASALPRFAPLGCFTEAKLRLSRLLRPAGLNEIPLPKT